MPEVIKAKELLERVVGNELMSNFSNNQVSERNCNTGKQILISEEVIANIFAAGFPLNNQYGIVIGHWKSQRGIVQHKTMHKGQYIVGERYKAWTNTA